MYYHFYVLIWGFNSNLLASAEENLFLSSNNEPFSSVFANDLPISTFESPSENFSPSEPITSLTEDSSLLSNVDQLLALDSNVFSLDSNPLSEPEPFDWNSVDGTSLSLPADNLFTDNEPSPFLAEGFKKAEADSTCIPGIPQPLGRRSLFRRGTGATACRNPTYNEDGTPKAPAFVDINRLNFVDLEARELKDVCIPGIYGESRVLVCSSGIEADVLPALGVRALSHWNLENCVKGTGKKIRPRVSFRFPFTFERIKHVQSLFSRGYFG